MLNMAGIDLVRKISDLETELEALLLTKYQADIRYIDQLSVIKYLLDENSGLYNRLDSIKTRVDLADGDYSTPELAYYEIKNFLDDIE